MCGRTVTGDLTWQQVYDLLNIHSAIPDEPISGSFNVPPTSMNPIVVSEGGSIHGAIARWGLVPHWFAKPINEVRFSSFNARSEEAHSKPVFRDALKSQHCLVPVKGYYEWSGSKGDKTPNYITVKSNAPAFCFAGLWTHVSLPNFTGYTYTVLTESAPAQLTKLHPRIPVILDESSYQAWLSNEVSIEDIARIPNDRISHHVVGKDVGNVRNNRENLIDPVA